MHASHDEYFVCTAVIFSTVFDVSIATYYVRTYSTTAIFICIDVCLCVRAREL